MRIVPIMIALSVGQVMNAAQAPQPRQAAAFSIAIETAASIVSANSEIKLTVTLTNTSDRDISVARSPARGHAESHTNILIRKEDGKPAPEKKYLRALKGTSDKDDLVIPGGSVISSPVKPGQVFTDEVVVSNLYDLSQPGKYSIQAERRDPQSNGLIESNVIIITVTP